MSSPKEIEDMVSSYFQTYTAESNVELELIIVIGCVCSGKTTFIKKNYAGKYIWLDASDIFMKLNNRISSYYTTSYHINAILDALECFEV